jgi:hypothetical protein
MNINAAKTQQAGVGDVTPRTTLLAGNDIYRANSASKGVPVT